jgi:hypothetical protein
MRTLRKVFCILILATLVISSSAMAAPAARSDGGHSIGSWALAVLDSVVAFLIPDEIGGVEPGVHSNEELQMPKDGTKLAEDEYGGAVDPHGPTQEFGGSEDPAEGDYGAVIEPNG